VDSYIPPKREPVGEGRNPIPVISENNITANKLTDLFFAGFQKISATRIRRAAAVRSSSWRIIEKFSRFI
jgi:hypothetical protein